MEANLLQKNAAIISLICGVLAAISIVLEIPFRLVGPLTYGLPLIVLLGIIFGIFGLKSTKKRLAIAGIILSLIPVIYLISFFLYMGRFI